MSTDNAGLLAHLRHGTYAYVEAEYKVLSTSSKSDIEAFLNTYDLVTKLRKRDGLKPTFLHELVDKDLLDVFASYDEGIGAAYKELMEAHDIYDYLSKPLPTASRSQDPITDEKPKNDTVQGGSEAIDNSNRDLDVVLRTYLED